MAIRSLGWGRDRFSLLWSLAPYAEQSPQTPPWEVALEGERQEQHSSTAAVHHSLKLIFSSLF